MGMFADAVEKVECLGKACVDSLNNGGVPFSRCVADWQTAHNEVMALIEKIQQDVSIAKTWDEADWAAFRRYFMKQ